MITNAVRTVALTRSVLALAALVGAASLALAQDAATTRPAVVQASDKAALTAAKGQEVTVEGVCTLASWSKSGKVMNIEFKEADQHFMAVAFEKNKDRLDKAFGGDATKSFSGAKLRVKGKLQEYGGKSQSMAGRLEIVITDPNQVTIMELAATQPGE